MLRSRLAFLAVACGLLFTLSGCRLFSDDDRPRLFGGNSRGAGVFSHRHAECECNHGQMPGIFDTAQSHGPVLMTPTSSHPQMHPPMPIPITNVPATQQPPNIFKIPQAAPTPYTPAH